MPKSSKRKWIRKLIKSLQKGDGEKITGLFEPKRLKKDQITELLKMEYTEWKQEVHRIEQTQRRKKLVFRLGLVLAGISLLLLLGVGISMLISRQIKDTVLQMALGTYTVTPSPIPTATMQPAMTMMPLPGTSEFFSLKTENQRYQDTWLFRPSQDSINEQELAVQITEGGWYELIITVNKDFTRDQLNYGFIWPAEEEIQSFGIEKQIIPSFINVDVETLFPKGIYRIEKPEVVRFGFKPGEQLDGNAPDIKVYLSRLPSHVELVLNRITESNFQERTLETRLINWNYPISKQFWYSIEDTETQTANEIEDIPFISEGLRGEFEKILDNHDKQGIVPADRRYLIIMVAETLSMSTGLYSSFMETNQPGSKCELITETLLTEGNDSQVLSANEGLTENEQFPQIQFNEGDSLNIFAVCWRESEPELDSEKLVFMLIQSNEVVQ